MTNDRMLPQIQFEKKLDVQIPSREWWISENSRNLLDSSVAVYTDGSLSCTGAGIGVYSSNLGLELSEPLGKYATIFQAEIYALLCASKEVDRAGINGRRVFFCSDSQAALKSLSNPRVDSKLVLECLNSLCELNQRNLVSLIWVPGHSNILGNEKADELAKRGAETAFTGPEPVIPISYNKGKSFFKQWITSEHNSQWRDLTSCRMCKKFVIEPSNSKAKYILNLKRNDLRMLIGVLTGHSYFMKHMHNVGLADSPTCLQCLEENEDSIHFIIDCPAFMHVRKQVFGVHFLDTNQSDKLTWNKILEFTKKTDRFSKEF